jgi:plastocyanin domain-containing protein
MKTIIVLAVIAVVAIGVWWFFHSMPKNPFL